MNLLLYEFEIYSHLNLHVIDKDTDLAEAAKIMVTQRISGIPVIESSLEEGKMKNQPIGIISKTDIVKALTGFELRNSRHCKFSIWRY